jgi:hypothetical protein
MRQLPALVISLLALAAAAIEPQQPAPGTPPKSGQESPAAEPEPEQSPAPPSDTESEPDAVPPDAEEEELPPLPPDAAAAGPSPQRFNPTEKVRADFPVSFPIDI